jgi:hypothetical protein
MLLIGDASDVDENAKNEAGNPLTTAEKLAKGTSIQVSDSIEDGLVDLILSDDEEYLIIGVVSHVYLLSL